MKKTLLLSLLIIGSLSASAQFPQNFDVACATTSFPLTSPHWGEYSPPFPANGTNGEWGCTATHGRPNTSGVPTPGVTCSGVWSSAYHLDTSYLLTPIMNLLPAYAGSDHIYLRFDTKKDNIVVSGKLAVLETVDTNFHVFTDLDLGSFVTPPFGDADSAGWVTHQADISAYKTAGPFYLAFRYTASTTAGTAWYIDNITIATNGLSVPALDKEMLPISVIGNSSSSQVGLSYTTSQAGRYKIMMYDMVGRLMYDGQVDAQSGTSTYVINGLNLHPGMYCIKMGNENAYGITKMIIQ